MTTRMNFRARPSHGPDLIHQLLLWALMSLLIFMAIAFLAGCAAASLRGNIKTAIETADSYTVRTTKLLQADLITVKQAEDRLKQIKQAQLALRAATDQVKSCDTLKPETCNAATISYNTATSVLGEVENWLIEQEARKPK